MYLYIDGAQAVSELEPDHCGGGKIVYSTNAGISGRVSTSPAGAYGLFGEIGGVAIFSAALSASQVTGLYDAAEGIGTPTPTPTPCDERTCTSSMQRKPPR
jgi:hypothetical protein